MADTWRTLHWVRLFWSTPIEAFHTLDNVLRNALVPSHLVSWARGLLAIGLVMSDVEHLCSVNGEAAAVAQLVVPRCRWHLIYPPSDQLQRDQKLCSCSWRTHHSVHSKVLCCILPASTSSSIYCTVRHKHTASGGIGAAAARQVRASRRSEALGLPPVASPQVWPPRARVRPIAERREARAMWRLRSRRIGDGT